MVLNKLSGRAKLADIRAMYLIEVVGDLDAKWLEFFDDISIVVTEQPGSLRLSTLCTHSSDQATVLGILNSLYLYGYPLVSLRLIDVA
jgi:hypothetical protein